MAATILKGNQKVLAARLSDAKFFWENDLRVAKAGMGEWAEGLKAVTFHNKLGSQADRIERIAALAREIAPLVGADADDAERRRGWPSRPAVGHGGRVPRTAGRDGPLLRAGGGGETRRGRRRARPLAPKGESDAVPTEPVSVAVALADKIDTLTGFWAIDEKPTGRRTPSRCGGRRWG
jgi:glycyl-tRNA synthetase beta chain